MFNLKNIGSTMLTLFTFMNRSVPHNLKLMRGVLLQESRECLFEIFCEFCSQKKVRTKERNLD